jgi:pimeloyl-ACP methyl ester carboxylesterase
MATLRTDDGVSISYMTWGPGPRNLLLMHGWGGSAAFWDEMLKHADLAGVRAITTSLRGHGDSEKATAGYTLDRFTKDMLAVADDTKADHFVLVGFSMSGKYAQYIAVAHPERVRGLILIAPIGAGEFPLPAETARTFCDAVGSRDRVLEAFAPTIQVPIRAEVMDTYLRDFVRIPRVALEETMNMFCKTSFADRVKAISVPTLVIGGAADPFVPPEYLRKELIERIPRARLVVLPCGHHVPMELPGETAALLTAFLAGLGESTSASPTRPLGSVGLN